MNENIISDFIEESLISLKNENLMSIPNHNIPSEMIDSESVVKENWIGWKAIKSNVTDKEIDQFECEIKLKFPKLYKSLLKYKYFYELEICEEISFFSHISINWQEKLKEYYFEYWEPEELIKKGFIPFADYGDWGVVCFDTNRMNKDDCPIVMFPNDTFYDKPVTFEELYTSFESMINRFLEELSSQ